MKEISKLVVLIAAAVTGILALFMGNNPIQVDDNYTNDVRWQDEELPESTLNYIPTQALGDELIEHTYYTVSYSSHHQNPEWVAYELQSALLERTQDQKRSNFRSDPATEAEAKSSDYSNSGYDRGHLVPAYDMNFNEQAMKESFYMTNVSPQVPDFNRGIWKSLESKVRKWAEEERRLYVIAGPLLRKRVSHDDRIIDDGPTVPRGFYKIILDYDGSNKKGIAFMFKNKEIDRPLEDFVTTIDKVEEYTNIDFFPNLNPEEERALESISSAHLWNFE